MRRGYVMPESLEHSSIGFESRSAAGQTAGALPAHTFGDDLIAEIKHLRAFAISLSGSVSAGDDLVQETLLRARSKSDQFRVGTNLRAWLLTILRNAFYSSFASAPARCRTAKACTRVGSR